MMPHSLRQLRRQRWARQAPERARPGTSAGRAARTAVAP
jgi:hypothetical protein